jgi:hypothetical protein
MDKIKTMLDELDSVLETKAKHVEELANFAVHGGVTQAIQLEHAATMKMRDIVGALAAQLGKAKK